MTSLNNVISYGRHNKTEVWTTEFNNRAMELRTTKQKGLFFKIKTFSETSGTTSIGIMFTIIGILEGKGRIRKIISGNNI